MLKTFEQEDSKYKKARVINLELLSFLQAYAEFNDALRAVDRAYISKAYTDFYIAIDKLNQVINKQFNSIELYKSYIDVLEDLQNLSIKKHPVFKNISKLPEYKGFLDTPVIINGEVSPLFKNQIYLTNQSKIRWFLEWCREKEHIEFSNQLYTYVRMSLNKASILSSELEHILKNIKTIDKEGIIINNPVELYLGSSNGKELYKREDEEYTIARFCKHCGRIIKHNESRCKGHNVCCFYYDKNEPWYREVIVAPNESIYTVSDEYYESVTLPNLFEELTHEVLLKELPKDEFLVTLHPRIERLGDIKVVSKRTGAIYLIDCKNYNNSSNLKKYILDDNGTYIKSILNKWCKFVFVVPHQHMNSCLLNYISTDKGINKFGYNIKNDLNICKWIINEDSKLESNLLGETYAE